MFTKGNQHLKGHTITARSSSDKPTAMEDKQSLPSTKTISNHTNNNKNNNLPLALKTIKPNTFHHSKNLLNQPNHKQTSITQKKLTEVSTSLQCSSSKLNRPQKSPNRKKTLKTMKSMRKWWRNSRLQLKKRTMKIKTIHDFIYFWWVAYLFDKSIIFHKKVGTKNFLINID